MPLTEQQRYQLKRAWLDDPERTFWVGLCRALPLPPRSLAAVATMEPKSAPSYVRLPMKARELRWEGDKLVSDARIFRNASKDFWPPLSASFVATSQDDKGELVAYAELQTFRETHQERIMAPRDELSVPVEVRI